MDFIGSTQKILALVASSFAVWKALQEFRKTKETQAASTRAIPGEPMAAASSAGADLGLYAVALLIAAIATLSLASAVLPRGDLASWSWSISIFIAAIFAAACVLPLNTTHDLRHLMWMCLAGLIPVAVLPFLTASTNGDAGLVQESVKLQLSLYMWLFLTSAFVVYAHSREAYDLRRRRRWVAIASAALVVTCAIGRGLESVVEVRNDPRAHRVVLDNAAAVQTDARALSRADQMTFYRFASEATLSPFYAGFPTTVSRPDYPDFETGASTLRPEVWQERMKQYIDFELTPAQRTDLLLKRLRAVHPGPTGNMPRNETPLPGLDAEARFRHFNDELILAVLRQNPTVAHVFLASNFYEKDLKERVATQAAAGEDSRFDRFSKVVEQKILGKDATSAAPEVYNDLDAKVFGLPLSNTVVLIREQYRALATESAKAATGQDLTKFIDAFEKLETDDRRNLLAFLAGSSRETEDRVTVLAQLAAHVNEAAIAGLVRKSGPEVARGLIAYRANHALPADPQLAASVEALATILETPNSITTFTGLLQSGSLNPQLQIGRLFKKASLELVGDLRKNLNSSEVAMALAIMHDPSGEGVKALLTASAPANAVMAPLLGRFIELRSEQREAILHNFAMDMYVQGGENTLWLFPQAIDQAAQYGDSLALAVASVFSLPGIGFAILLGMLFGSKLLSISFNADELSRQPSNALSAHAQPTSQWAFVGREQLMDNLKHLSLRSSGTVGLVGRRGIGKTRILRELLQDYDKAQVITVWLDCPTSMSQSDFVQSIGERVVDIAETHFAAAAGIPNNARRRLDRKLLNSTAIAVALLMILYAGAAYLLPDLFAAPLVLPSMVLGGIGTALLFLRISGSATTASRLSATFAAGASRFEWQRAHDSIVQMADRLQARRDAPSSRQTFRLRGGWIPSLIVVAPVLLIVFAVLAEEAIEVLIGAAMIAGLFVGWRLLLGKERPAEPALSAVSFTYHFRQFVMDLTERVRAGALGARKATTDVVLVVVVDELDKIVDRDELRAFIRVMKSVFDIPGARFYLSISQDAYRDLVLGSALGKNEFDSSFDHIAVVAPMDLDSARQLAKNYFQSLQQIVPDDATIEVIAGLGRGVPRDILRRCDTVVLLAAEKGGSLDERLLTMERQGLLSGVQYLVGLNERVSKAFTSDRTDLAAILDLITSNGFNEQVARVLTENFVYVQLLAAKDPAIRRELVRRYYRFLYDLPALPLDSIRAGLSIISSPAPMATVDDRTH